MADKRKMKEVTLDNSEVWDKEEPIEGTFVRTETNVGPNESNMYTIKTDSGEVKVWGSTVLDDKLMSVPQGTFVRIEYEGKLKSKKGNEYHGYKVFFDEDSVPEVPTVDANADLNEIFPEK